MRPRKYARNNRGLSANSGARPSFCIAAARCPTTDESLMRLGGTSVMFGLLKAGKLPSQQVLGEQRHRADKRWHCAKL